MAAIGVLDVTKRAVVTCTSVRNNTSGPIVAEIMPTKRTALASVRYNTSGPIVADFIPTKQTALASVRSNTSGPIAGLFDPIYRTAYVSVLNNTNKPLLGVSVVHKYSSVYKQQRQWGIIRPGERPSDSLEVEYHTGFLTTGYDWWLVTWYSPDMQTLYYSDPNNFRGFIDTLEGFAPDAIAAAAGAVVGLSTSLTGPGAVAAAAAAAVAAKATTSALFSSESTVGFKAHTLREEDDGRLTEIIINPDSTITLVSPSGDSDTVFSSRPAPTK